MNFRSALLLIAAAATVNHSDAVIAQPSSLTPTNPASAAYGAAPVGSAASAPHAYGGAKPSATTAKPVNASATGAPHAYGAPKPAATSVKPATGYGSASSKSKSKKSRCFEVSVEGDATYCIAGPLCSGAGAKPAGTNCPKAGDAAVRNCLKTLKSYAGADKCVAPVNAVCKKIQTGAWGCVWDTAATTATATNKPAGATPHAYGGAKPSATTAKPVNASAAGAPHAYGAPKPAATTVKPASSTATAGYSAAGRTVATTMQPPASTTRAPSATDTANQQLTPASTTVVPEYVVAYKSFAAEESATNDNESGGASEGILLGSIAVGVAAAVTATVVYQHKKRQNKKSNVNMEGGHVKIVSPAM